MGVCNYKLLIYCCNEVPLGRYDELSFLGDASSWAIPLRVYTGPCREGSHAQLLDYAFS